MNGADMYFASWKFPQTKRSLVAPTLFGDEPLCDPILAVLIGSLGTLLLNQNASVPIKEMNLKYFVRKMAASFSPP